MAKSQQRGNRASQLLFDGLQLCLHAIPPGLPFDLEFAPTSFAADSCRAIACEC